jgi:hypothetical protein
VHHPGRVAGLVHRLIGAGRLIGTDGLISVDSLISAHGGSGHGGIRTHGSALSARRGGPVVSFHDL